MAKLFASANPEISDREKRNMERSRKLASQGMVLLINEERIDAILLMSQAGNIGGYALADVLTGEA